MKRSCIIGGIVLLLFLSFFVKEKEEKSSSIKKNNVSITTTQNELTYTKQLCCESNAEQKRTTSLTEETFRVCVVLTKQPIFFPCFCLCSGIFCCGFRRKITEKHRPQMARGMVEEAPINVF